MIFARMNNAISHLLPKICEHPLNIALLKGTLPRHVFRFYLEQDYFYLSDFAQALNITAKKLSSKKHADELTAFSREIIQSRENLHLKYLGEPRSSRFFQPQRLNTAKIPVISFYTKHLLTTARTSTPAEAIASIIPCPLLYCTAGIKMLANPDFTVKNPYYSWILSYSNQQFTSAGKSMVRIAEELGNKTPCPIIKENMISAFVKSAEYEILFLDSVYKNMDAANESHMQNTRAFK